MHASGFAAPTARIWTLAALSVLTLAGCGDVEVSGGDGERKGVAVASVMGGTAEADRDPAPAETTAPAAVAMQQDATLCAGMLEVRREFPEEVRVGARFAYRLLVKNAAGRAAHDVVVYETVPEGVELLGSEPAWSGSPPDSAQSTAAGTYSWRLGNLDPGDSITIELQASARTEGELELCGYADARPSLCSTLRATAPALKLVRMWTVEGADREVRVDEAIALTYRVENTGSGTTDPVIVEEELPDGLTTADGEQRVRLELGPIEAGDPVEKVVHLRTSTPGEYTGRASARAGELTTEAEGERLRVLGSKRTSGR